MRSRGIASAGITLVLAAALSGCTVRDDSVRENQLESLRVLGIASFPADISTGETAALSALVYAPEGQTISYQWSWCPAQAGADGAFACLIDEADLQAAWATLNTGTVLPGYDLGTAETASVELAIEVEDAITLCELLTVDQPNREIALFTCLSSLGLNIKLRVNTAEEEVIAIRSIPIVAPDAERNQNPAIGTELTISQRGGGLLEPGDSLRAEEIYDIAVEIDPDEGEIYTPAPQEGQDPPEPQREGLFLSWFVTTGSTHRKGEVRTSYFEGGDFEEFRENTWDMDFDITTDIARLFVVLRDERGGISWADFSFGLEEAQ
jgi:hypothetical protein